MYPVLIRKSGKIFLRYLSKKLAKDTFNLKTEELNKDEVEEENKPPKPKKKPEHTPDTIGDVRKLINSQDYSSNEESQKRVSKYFQEAYNQ